MMPVLCMRCGLHPRLEGRRKICDSCDADPHSLIKYGKDSRTFRSRVSQQALAWLREEYRARFEELKVLAEPVVAMRMDVCTLAELERERQDREAYLAS